MREPVVVDTNVLFSALLRSRSGFAEHLLTADRTFCVCESILVELFKHKERIVRHSALTEEEVIRFLYILLRRLSVHREDLIPAELRQQAWALCRDVDPSDTPQVALTLHLGGLLWTGDAALRRGLRERGFDRFFEPAAGSISG